MASSQRNQEMKSSTAYLVAPLIGWLIAQVAKNLIGKRSRRKGGVEKYLMSGGMPSAHTATVVTLITVIFINEGFSTLFAVAAWFAAIIVYDALVVRRSVGEQGIALTKLLGKNGQKEQLPFVALGHKPLEVIAGAAIGVVTGIVVALFITI